MKQKTMEMKTDWIGKDSGVPAPFSFSPPRGGNWKHGESHQFREALKVLKVGDYTTAEIKMEQQSKRIADKIGIRIATRRIRESDQKPSHFRAYRVA